MPLKCGKCNIFLSALTLFLLTGFYIVRHQRHEESSATNQTTRINSDLEEEFIEAIPTKEDSLEHFFGELDARTMVRCPIFTFVKALNKNNEGAVRLWVRAWYRAGFQPYILTEKDALTRPEYGSLIGKAPALEFHSGYMRWLALSSVQGGAYADFDVLPLAGPVDLFSEYRSENCKATPRITLTGRMELSAFVIDQETSKVIVKKLIGERQLKGADNVWLGLHAKEYHVTKSQYEERSLVDFRKPKYLQKLPRGVERAEYISTLKASVLRANLLNSKRVYILNAAECPGYHTVLGKIFEFPQTEGIPDASRVLPNLPFQFQVESIKEINQDCLEEVDGIGTLTIVLLDSRISFLQKLFPGREDKPVEGLLHELRSMIKSGKFIFLPVTLEPASITLFLEFKLGMLIPMPMDFECKPADRADTLHEKEVELYEFILRYLEYELAKISEFS